MTLVKKIVLIGLPFLPLLALVLHHRACGSVPGDSFEDKAPMRPARADLAEAVFTMVLENAERSGLVLAHPVTLCEACVAAHLGRPQAEVRERCTRACSLAEEKQVGALP